MAKRPLTDEEFSKIINLLNNGFSYNKDGKQKRVRPNRKVALALVIEATTGLRISDIVKLKVKHFQTTKLELHEEKTNKLQYREINANLMALVNRYAVENKLDMDDCIIDCNKRNINKYLEIVTNYLGLENIGTHSFRKYYAVYVYNETKDIRILQNLLNHSSIATTQRYLGVDYKKIDKISASVDFTNVLNLQ